MRNLKKHQLGGVIFGGTNKTIQECLSKHLFGLPAQHWSYVKNIEPGLPLFLFNYSERIMYGIYEAASSGKQYIDPYAWTEEGSERTRYPAQVQIITRQHCQGLRENLFKSIIINNYYSSSHFSFELDHDQVRKLCAEFSRLVVSSRPVIPRNPPIQKVVQKLPSESKHDESRAPEPYLANDVVGSVGASCNLVDSINNNHLVESSLGNDMAGNEKNDHNLKQLTTGVVDAAIGDNVELGKQVHEDTMMISGKTNSEISLDSKYCPDIIAKLCREIEELQTFKLEQTSRTEGLEMKLSAAEQVIRRLKNRCNMVSSPNLLPRHTQSAAEQVIRRLENRCNIVSSPNDFWHNMKNSIFLIGGHDGLSWSSAIHSFSPSHDYLRSLEPMSSVRAYAAVTQLNHEFYVIGGGTRSEWYDTVESYNIVNNQWTVRPSLRIKSGCLAGAALNGKIFALGGGTDGGTGLDCLSDVQMLNLDIGYWMPSQSMIEKRFGLAAVELNGAIYAVGGYDGAEYLKSAERFDPRERCWTHIGTMDTRRGCHSLVVMKERIYAIGGCDGEKMVASMEVYDPRVDAWIPGDPMNRCRGYLSAAVLNESIYAIGGVKENEEMEKTVEVYKVGQGWKETELRSVGKICFASTIVLGEN